MYKPYKGGSSVEVQGLKIYLPKRPPKGLIAGFDLPKKQQKWKRTPLPSFWSERREEEIYKQQTNPKHTDPVLEEFRRQQWGRRLYGYWFYNHGKPTYITGQNYYYLNWCQFDHPENDGYPIYYDFTRLTFYFRQYCTEDPHCLGYLVVGPRGTGKSSEEVACILESMTRPPRRRQAAIQSKSEDDAKQKIFKEKMVEVFKVQPDFFKPIANHGSNPENKLSFFRDTVRGKKAKDVVFSNEAELANVIYPVPAKEKALDGGTYAEILNDEIGKTDPKKEADVYKRMGVNRFCVFRNNRKRGLIRATTTVEEMDKGGDECKKVWDESDVSKRTENGFTLSGLYRYFISAIDAGTQFADKYGSGFIDREKAQRFHLIEREARKNDSQALSSYIRKNPFNPEEAFMKDGEDCVFNAMVLNETYTYLNLDRNITTRGDFIWKDGLVDGKVIFKPNSRNGRFEVAWLPEKDEQTNLVTKVYARHTTIHAPNPSLGHIVRSLEQVVKDQYKPLNDAKFAIATDPVDHGVTVDGRRSNSAAYAFRKFDLLVDDPNKLDKEDRLDWETHNFVVEYIYRSPEPDMYYEDMIKLCAFFGCQILAENQKRGIITYFNTRGYGLFIMNRPKFTFTAQGTAQDTPGIPASKPLIQQYTDKLQTFVHYHGHRLKFKRLTADLLDFDPNKPTKHDPTVAAGLTLIASEKEMPKKVDTVGGLQYVKYYDNTGIRSKPFHE